MTNIVRERRPSSPQRKPWAEVRLVDADMRRVAIITDWGYTVADIKTGTLRTRDVVEGEVETLGDSTWTNVSTGLPVKVVVTHVQTTMLGAERIMQRSPRRAG